MGRGIRFVPEGGALVEVTGRTIQGRLLLRPSQELRAITLGILARAQREHPVQIHAFVFLSNHMLCGAPHKTCYGEYLVMWSWRTQLNQGGGVGGGDCA